MTFLHNIAIVFFGAFLLSPLSLLSQANDYYTQIEECYNKVEFKDDKYRLKHEPECYLDQSLPDFEINDINGNLISKESLRGKITVINFWFVNCPPCIAEIPGLNEVSKRYQSEDVIFLAASIDSKEVLEKFIKRKGSFGFKIIPESASLFYETFALRTAFPTTIILDEEGVMRYFSAEGFADFRASKRVRKKLSKAIDQLLGKVQAKKS